MSRLRFTISLSLDGFVAGPRQSLKDPLGIGGEQPATRRRQQNGAYRRGHAPSRVMPNRRVR